MWLRKLLILLVTALAMLLLSPADGYPEAHADVLQCPYPATGLQVDVLPLLGRAQGYVCDYPLERNKAHLHAEYGGYTVSGSILATLNPANSAFGAAGGASIGVGMTMWSQSWRCPDERYIAAPPNGIGAWKAPQNWDGVKCPAVQRAPLALNAPWPPDNPDIIFVQNQILPPGQPDPTAGPPVGNPDVATLPGGNTNTDPVPLNPVPTEPNGT